MVKTGEVEQAGGEKGAREFVTDWPTLSAAGFCKT